MHANNIGFCLVLAKRLIYCVAVTASLMGVWGGCSGGSTSDGDWRSAGGRRPGQVDLLPLEVSGLNALIASHRGKIVVVDVWATYCQPCMRDFHQLVELSKRYSPSQVACISLSLDNQGLRPLDQVVPQVLHFLNEQRATFDNVIMLEDSDQMLRALRLSSVPAVLVYNKQGRLLETVKPSNGQSPYTRVGQIVSGQIANSP